MNVIFATMDVGGFNVIHPLVSAFQRTGHKIIIAAGGQSLSRWNNSDLRPTYLDEPDLSKLDIQLVVSGIGSTKASLEDKLGLQANRLGIPFVAREDAWGTAVRLRAKPDLIVTLDTIAERLLRDDPRLVDGDILLAGHPLASHKEKPAHRAWADRVRNESGKRLVFFAGSTTETEEMLELALDSLAGSRERFHLVTRLHPCFDEFDTSGRSRTRIDGLLRGFGHGARMPKDWLVEQPPDATGDDLAAVSDITLSCGTVQFVAAMCGRLAVNLDTPESRAVLERSDVTYRCYPGVGLGISANLTEPTDDLVSWIEAQRDAIANNVSKYRAENKTLSSDEIVERILKTFF